MGDFVRNNEPLNPGRPLDDKDFWRGTQMRMLTTNETTDEMLRLPELEKLGEETVKRLNREQKNILAPLAYHWPNGILYYTIDAAFSDSERAVIASGFTHVEENSCIRFVARTDQHDYVDIIPGGGGCYAQIPYRTGRGRMEIGLQQNGCVYLKVVVHELLHSLGFMHEMNRPDRDDYVSMVWSNIQANGASQFFKDAWVGTDETTLPAECPYSGQPDGADYSTCYSGWKVDACGMAYDYNSIMHYGLTSFAINSAQNVMNPTDGSVTSVGSQTLSSLDISKLQCLYNCDGTSAGTCGGHYSGDTGVVESSGDKTCKWLLAVPDGFAIEISFESFDIADCSTGSVKVYNGKDDTAALMGTYCYSTVPTVLTSGDKNLYIVYTSTGASNTFKATWKKVTVTCC